MPAKISAEQLSLIIGLSPHSQGSLLGVRLVGRESGRPSPFVVPAIRIMLGKPTHHTLHIIESNGCSSHISHPAACDCVTPL